jgi:hypothetical protein
MTVIEAELVESERKYSELWDSLTPDTRTLIAPGGPLDPSEARALAAVAGRPLLRRVLLAPARLAYRLGGARRRSQAEAAATTPEAFALHFAAPNVEHMREHMPRGNEDALVPDP